MAPERSHAKLNVHLLHSMEHDRSVGPERSVITALCPLNVGVMSCNSYCKELPTVYNHVVEVNMSTGVLAIQTASIEWQELGAVSLRRQVMSFLALQNESCVSNTCTSPPCVVAAA